MAVKMEGVYLGNKRIELTHTDSGTKITTAAPKDNNGDGSSFSPTDLCTASLGACMMTIIGIVAEKRGFSVDGMRMTVEKEMVASPTRRIGTISVAIHLPAAMTLEQREWAERGAQTCPVHHSLHPDVEARISFLYDV
jgi:putative redox protein